MAMPGPVWASEAIDLITDVLSAADVVGALATEAESTLTRPASRPVRDSPRGT
jgi:nitronate monooxygenase